MSTTKQTFNIDKENKQIVIQREFEADVKTLWDAYTTPEILDQWWAPAPWKARTKSMDFREGGAWIYTMVGPEGEEHWAMAKYELIVKHEKYIGLDYFTDENSIINPTLPSTQWEVKFEKSGLGTLVTTTMTFSDLTQLETIIQMGFKEGYTFAMNGLDELLVRLKK